MGVTRWPRTSATRSARTVTALPKMWPVQALHTLMPQPYLRPVTPSPSRRTHSRAMSSASSAGLLKLAVGGVTVRDLRGLRGDTDSGDDRLGAPP